MYRKLRGKIKEVYGTQAKFANAMDMKPSALSQRLTGVTKWQMPEVAKACELLDIPFDNMHLFFLT